jgi:dCMP deaminase
MTSNVGRGSWAQYFMGIAEKVAERATCPRKHVGCVLVRDNNILATGYNGSISGDYHCDDVGCLLEGVLPEIHCVRTTHAEVNAVLQAAKHGAALAGCVAFVTLRPCFSCYNALANAGIVKVVYKDFYGGMYPANSPTMRMQQWDGK